MRPAAAARAERLPAAAAGGPGPVCGQGSPGAFPPLPRASRCHSVPGPAEVPCTPSLGSPTLNPLVPGLFARNSGQRAAVAKRCPPPSTICTLRAAVHSPVSAPSPSWRSAAHPASPLLQTASDSALQALTTPLPRPQEAQTVPTGAWGASYECIFWAPGHLIQRWSFSSVSCWKGHPLIPQGRASERLDTGL